MEDTMIDCLSRMVVAILAMKKMPTYGFEAYRDRNALERVFKESPCRERFILQAVAILQKEKKSEKSIQVVVLDTLSKFLRFYWKGQSGWSYSDLVALHKHTPWKRLFHLARRKVQSETGELERRLRTSRILFLAQCTSAIPGFKYPTNVPKFVDTILKAEIYTGNLQELPSMTRDSLNNGKTTGLASLPERQAALQILRSMPICYPYIPHKSSSTFCMVAEDILTSDRADVSQEARAFWSGYEARMRGAFSRLILPGHSKGPFQVMCEILTEKRFRGPSRFVILKLIERCIALVLELEAQWIATRTIYLQVNNIDCDPESLSLFIFVIASQVKELHEEAEGLWFLRVIQELVSLGEPRHGHTALLAATEHLAYLTDGQLPKVGLRSEIEFLNACKAATALANAELFDDIPYSESLASIKAPEYYNVPTQLERRHWIILGLSMKMLPEKEKLDLFDFITHRWNGTIVPEQANNLLLAMSTAYTYRDFVANERWKSFVVSLLETATRCGSLCTLLSSDLATGLLQGFARSRTSLSSDVKVALLDCVMSVKDRHCFSLEFKSLLRQEEREHIKLCQSIESGILRGVLQLSPLHQQLERDGMYLSMASDPRSKIPVYRSLYHGWRI